MTGHDYYVRQDKRGEWSIFKKGPDLISRFEAGVFESESLADAECFRLNEPHRIAEILRKGGHFICHQNDLETLRSSLDPDSLLAGPVKIIVDKTGFLEEGKPVVTSAADGIHCTYRL